MRPPGQRTVGRILYPPGSNTNGVTRLKKFIFLSAFTLLTAALSGCATVEDLKVVRRELDQKLTRVVEDNAAAMDVKFTDVKNEQGAIRGEVAQHAETIAALQKKTTETDADIADVRSNMQQLRGQVDALRKDLTTIATRVNRRDEEAKDIRDKLNDAIFKLNFIENFLGIGKREDLPEGGGKNDKARELPRGKQDKEAVYASAYELFKDGKYDKAREMFQNFLKQYSDTEYSDNAQFWIAECFYFEKKYENAILEYEKVSKNYPDGDKVPYALLKQGITFLHLGDKISAGLVLQKVIKDYPNTNQAGTAKATLLNIK